MVLALPAQCKYMDVLGVSKPHFIGKEGVSGFMYGTVPVKIVAEQFHVLHGFFTK